jgi:putative phage-type endonuclease
MMDADYLAALDQDSDEWRLARCGSLGASDVHKVVAKIKNGWASSRDDIKADLGCEIMTGEPAETYQSQEMLIGKQREPIARAAYAYEHNEVQRVGMIIHPRIKGTHASPDGFIIGTDGGLEIKCPKKSTHWATLGGAPVDKRYRLQCQWQMACSGKQWVHLVSFHPAFPVEMQLHCTRIERDDKLIAELEQQVEEFLHELAQEIAARRSRYMREAA